MKIKGKIKGFEGKDIEIQMNRFFTKATLLIDNKPVPKGPKRGQMLLHRNNGEEVIAKWIWQLLDVPKLQLGEDIVDIVEPLDTIEWVWCSLPIIMIWLVQDWPGIVLGIVLVIIAVAINVQIFRSNKKTELKFGQAGLVTIAMIALHRLLVDFLF